MSTFEFIQSDTRPFFAVVIKNSLTNEPVDLTGTTVTFYMLNLRTRQELQLRAGTGPVQAVFSPTEPLLAIAFSEGRGSETR